MSDLKNTPKISVIVPVYNVEKYLRRCLDSIAAQTFTDWECICVDDGSPDGSGAICDEYARDDSRFVVIHKENGGVSSARNAGLDAARGEWIGFVDSDDWVEREIYEILLKTATESNVQIAECYCKYIDENEAIISRDREKFYKEDKILNGREYKDNILNGFSKFYLPRTVLFHAEEIQENKIRFNSLLSCYEDVDFVLRYANFVKFAYVSASEFYIYRKRISSLSHHKREDINKSVLCAPAFFSSLQKQSKIDFSNEYINSLMNIYCASLFYSKNDFSFMLIDFSDYIRKLYGIQIQDIKNPRKYIFGVIKKYIKIDSRGLNRKTRLKACLFAPPLPICLQKLLFVIFEKLKEIRE